MIKLSKAALRRGALDRRQALSALSRRKMSEAICAAIANMKELQDARTVMSYNAFGYEADMRVLHAKLRAKGVQLCFPVSSEDGKMEAYLPEDARAFVSGLFCISEPDKEHSVRIDPEEIDVLIVPCAAFDAKLNRIGQGGGYYDRFLPRCENAVSIGAAFSVQQVEEIEPQEHDVNLNAVVTEKRIFKARNS